MAEEKEGPSRDQKYWCGVVKQLRTEADKRLQQIGELGASDFKELIEALAELHRFHDEASTIDARRERADKPDSQN
jgi:hypothetical protein